MKDKLHRIYKKYPLKHKQQKINKKFKKDGLTDEIFEEQVKINRACHELDIPNSKFIYKDFVQ